MNFDKIKEVELYKLGDLELKEPIEWKVKELNGETEFQK